MALVAIVVATYACKCGCVHAQPDKETCSICLIVFCHIFGSMSLPPQRAKPEPATGGSTEPMFKTRGRAIKPTQKKTTTKLVAKVWNKKRKMTKTDRQHLFVPREDVPLFLATSVYFASPMLATLIWLTMVTSRRISEALRLRGCDLHLTGGPHCDTPYVWFGVRDDERGFKGLGKLGVAGEVVAKMSQEAVLMVRAICERGVQWEVLEPLKPFQTSHPAIFKKYRALSKKVFCPTLEDQHLFPALKKSSAPWLTRQTAWNAISRTRTVMFELTGKRRYNPDTKFNGSHVTTHGATRHTSASLLMFNPHLDRAPPSEAAILEVQQRADAHTFQKHYHHVHAQQVAMALSYAWVDPPFCTSAPSPSTGSQSVEIAAQHMPAIGGIPESLPAEPHKSSTEGMPVLGGAAGIPHASKASLETTPASPSRNAWRKQKRRCGLAVWQVNQLASNKKEHEVSCRTHGMQHFIESNVWVAFAQNL